jgi:hypothetical protein
MKQEFYIEGVESLTRIFNRQMEARPHAYLRFGKVEKNGPFPIQTVHFRAKFDKIDGKRMLDAFIDEPEDDAVMQTFEYIRGDHVTVLSAWAKATQAALAVHNLRMEILPKVRNCQTGVRTICDLLGWEFERAGDEHDIEGGEYTLADQVRAANPDVDFSTGTVTPYLESESAIRSVRKVIDAKHIYAVEGTYSDYL